MFHSLKEQKRTMRSERKRTGCPTLLSENVHRWALLFKVVTYKVLNTSNLCQ